MRNKCNIINNKLLSVVDNAKENPRLRMNYNFHESPDSKSPGLLNV